MLSHERIWAAIDEVARRYSLTTSGLARRAGLDPTTFNPSKRTGPDGRDRWPSTESLAKILKATGMSIGEFIGLLDRNTASQRNARRETTDFRAVPLLGFAQAGAGGFFDDGGFPAGHGWDQVDAPLSREEGTYALKVSGDSMMPVYRHGDTIIVSPAREARQGDRVVVRTRDGEVMAKVFEKRTTKSLRLASLNPEHPTRVLPLSEVDWIARILWASQ